MPEFQGRQVVTLHNQRDFLFFRRHRFVPPFSLTQVLLTFPRRYAFRSTEKVQLQEIGPRFTLKLRSLRKGLPAVKNLGEVSKDLEFDTFEDEEKPPQNSPVVSSDDSAQADDAEMTDLRDDSATSANPSKTVVPPKEDEYVWMWKVSTIRAVHATSAY